MLSIILLKTKFHGSPKILTEKLFSLRQATVNLIHTYCDIAKFHGFHEWFYSRTRFTKFLWACILIGSIVMTCFQIVQVADNIAGDTTQTKLSILDADKPAVYPPYVLQYKYFTNWLDLHKVEEYQMDYETLIYTMSYFYPVYTSRRIDVELARRNLAIIMKRHFFENLYEFGLELSRRKPANFISNETLERFLDPEGHFYYIAQLNEEFLESEQFVELSEHTMQVRAYSTFEDTLFNEEFKRMYNRSFLNEYKKFKMFVYGQSGITQNLESTIPFYINSAGEKNTFNKIDIFLNNYKFFLTGTLYNWMPTATENCSKGEEAKFYTECLYECSTKHKLEQVTSCQLYYVPDDFELNPNVNPEKICDFDQELVNGEEDLESVSSNDTVENCIDKCLAGCVEWKYHSTEAIYPNQASKTLNARVTGTVILAYSERAKIMVISMVPLYTWYGSLATVGGMLGLWMGGSILAFIQLIYIFCCVPVEDAYVERRQRLENEKRTRREQRLQEQLQNNIIDQQQFRNAFKGVTGRMSALMSKKRNTEEIQNKNGRSIDRAGDTETEIQYIKLKSNNCESDLELLQIGVDKMKKCIQQIGEDVKNMERLSN